MPIKELRDTNPRQTIREIERTHLLHKGDSCKYIGLLLIQTNSFLSTRTTSYDYNLFFFFFVEVFNNFDLNFVIKRNLT